MGGRGASSGYIPKEFVIGDGKSVRSMRFSAEVSLFGRQMARSLAAVERDVKKGSPRVRRHNAPHGKGCFPGRNEGAKEHGRVAERNRFQAA